ncbi:MAG: HutD family protein [Lactobacillales bacterium]|jgi:environmental stress-induced protein Ves|nr:HutD family protein [Lactobacillales bacterium]
MKVKKLVESDFTVTNWSGGTTRQLFIYPENSDYEKRNFDFRISSATVEEEKTTFTALPEYHRILMVLENQVTLFHEVSSVHLKPYEQTSFEGSRVTKSEGCCTDFNLMFTDDYFGEVTAKIGKAEEILTPHAQYFFYSITDNITFEIGQTTILIHAGELMSLSELSEKEEIKINSSSQPAWIQVKLTKK